jgi:hypothetical protein
MNQPKWDSRFWLTILIVWALGISAISWEHTKPTWLFLSLIICAASLSRQQGAIMSPAELSIEPATTMPQTPSFATQKPKTELSSTSSSRL